MEDTLQELGLSRRESICYLAMLELGSSKVGAIVKKSGTPSSKIYEVLDRLAKRGLVSYVIKGKIRHYQASDPKALLGYLDERRKKIEDILPKLSLMQNLSSRQSVELFEGQKAIFSLFTNLIADTKKGEKYLVFSIEEEKSEAANLFFKNLAVRRKEKGLEVRLLKNIKYYRREKHTKLELRYTYIVLPQGITIFRDNVILLSWSGQPIAVKIESETVSRQMRAFFEGLWKAAKR